MRSQHIPAIFVEILVAVVVVAVVVILVLDRK
jgi:hypothetical protein